MQTARKRSFALYWQVLVAIAAGAVLGALAPKTAVAFRPLGDGFIKLIKATVAPLIFVTLVSGVAGAGDLRRVGRIGWRAIVYFEVMSTLSLILGLFVGNWLQPGAGPGISAAPIGNSDVSQYATAARKLGIVDFLLKAVPDSLVGSLGAPDLLPVLITALLVGAAAAHVGGSAAPFLALVHSSAEVLYGVVALAMRFAPLAAFGAIAFTVGQFGATTLISLLKLMGCVYLTCIIFIFGFVGLTVRLAGLRLWPLLRYLREELLLVVGTSSSEPALPRMLQKLDRLGCGKTVTGLVLPAGYSFNLDGTSIYLSLAALFIAQATHTPFSIRQQILLLAVLLLTSKGAAAVTGGGFVTLAATLSATGALPMGGLALLLGVDRFMSEARAVTNLIGNAAAVIVVSRWEKQLDLVRARSELGIHNHD